MCFLWGNYERFQICSVVDNWDSAMHQSDYQHWQWTQWTQWTPTATSLDSYCNVRYGWAKPSIHYPGIKQLNVEFKKNYTRPIEEGTVDMSGHMTVHLKHIGCYMTYWLEEHAANQMDCVIATFYKTKGKVNTELPEENSNQK